MISEGSRVTNRNKKKALYGRKNRKKCGAHTHVRTTVQLDKHNIHVGCCLFSHNNNPYYYFAKYAVELIRCCKVIIFEDATMFFN